MSDASGTAPIKSCCLSGHLHEGTPTGSQQTIHGLPTYVAPAPEGADGKATVVFLTDIFGFELLNTRLLADEWASKGYTVLVPDVLSGDPISHDLLNVIVPNLREQARKTAVEKAADTVKMGASFGPWALKHRDAVTVPIWQAFLEAVRADPASASKPVVAVGFCFGGRHAILAASGETPLVDAAVAFHPSGVAIPAELEALTRPTAILVGDKDAMLSVDQIEQAKQVFDALAKKHQGTTFDVRVYEDAVHGFSVRGDMTEPSERALKEAGNKDALAFLDAVL